MDASKNSIFAATLIALCFVIVVNALGAEHEVGSGNDDWWITYPDGSSESGEKITHPQWVLDALEDNPVLIYIHKTCEGCGPQTEAIAQVVNEQGNELTYFNLSGEGDDVRANEAGIIYDPNESLRHYVPMTIILTLMQSPDGKDQVIWHSADQPTGKDWIESYIEDAIRLHNEAMAN